MRCLRPVECYPRLMQTKLRPSGLALTRLALILTGVFFSTVGQAQLTVVLISNYDAKLSVAGELHHISNQTKVRSAVRSSRAVSMAIGQSLYGLGNRGIDLSTIGNGVAIR